MAGTVDAATSAGDPHGSGLRPDAGPGAGQGAGGSSATRPAAGAGLPCVRGTSAGPFLSADGLGLTCQGARVELTGFTFYPAMVGGAAAWHRRDFQGYIDHALDMGVAAGQNLVRPTDEWDRTTAGQSVTDPILWQNMDYLVQAARRRGMFVVLDLSAYRALLISQGRDPLRASSWTGLLRAVTARYAKVPTVAFYSVLGEPPAPRSEADVTRLLAFYRSTTNLIHRYDPHHLVTVGGFLHMDERVGGVPWWWGIDALPNNDLVTIKVYSRSDLALLPALSIFARRVGKPAVVDEFGMPQGQGDAAYSGVAPYNGIATGRAAFYADVYRLGRSAGVAGFVFWNMGCQLSSRTYDVNPGTPAVWQVVQANAAGAVGAGAGGQLCP